MQKLKNGPPKLGKNDPCGMAYISAKNNTTAKPNTFLKS